MGIKEILEKLRARRERFKEMGESVRMQEMIEERKLSNEERELNRFLEEERQRQVKEQLEFFRKKRLHEDFNPPSILKAKNVFNNKQNMLKEKCFFDHRNTLFRGGSIFTNGSG